MKKLAFILILSIINIISYAQLDTVTFQTNKLKIATATGTIILANGATIYNNTADTLFLKETNVKIEGNLTVTGNSLIEMPHCFYSKRDTSGFTLALPRWSWVKFTGLTEKENYLFTRTTGDTIQYQGTANSHNNIYVHVNGTTNNSNDDVWIRVLNIRTGEIFYGMVLSGGSSNFSEWIIIGYDITAKPLDKYVIQARNKTNSNALQYIQFK